MKQYGAKQIVMRDKTLTSFSLLLSVAVKHFTRSEDNINHLQAIDIKLCECVSLCLP